MRHLAIGLFAVFWALPALAEPAVSTQNGPGYMTHSIKFGAADTSETGPLSVTGLCEIRVSHSGTGTVQLWAVPTRSTAAASGTQVGSNFTASTTTATTLDPGTLWVKAVASVASPDTLMEVHCSQTQVSAGGGTRVDADGDGLYELAYLWDADGDGSSNVTCTAKDAPDPACKWDGDIVNRDVIDDINCAIHGCGFGQMERTGDLIVPDTARQIAWPCWNARIAAQLGTATAACEFNDPWRHENGTDATFDDCHDSVNDASYGHCAVDGEGEALFVASLQNWQGTLRGEGFSRARVDTANGSGAPNGTMIYNDMGPLLDGSGNSWFGQSAQKRLVSMGFHQNVTSTVHMTGASAGHGSSDSKGWWRITGGSENEEDGKEPYVCIQNTGGTVNSEYRESGTAGDLAFGDQMLISTEINTTLSVGAVSFVLIKSVTSNQGLCATSDEREVRFASSYYTRFEDALTISASTNATPIEITTSAAHGLETDEQVRISGTGISAIDGNVYTVTRVTGTRFALNGTTAPGSTASAGSATPLLLANDPLPFFAESTDNNGLGPHAVLIHARSDYFDGRATVADIRIGAQDPWNEDGGDCSESGVWTATADNTAPDYACDTMNMVGLWGGGRFNFERSMIGPFHHFGMDGGAHTGFTTVREVDFGYGQGNSIMDVASGWRLYDVRIFDSQFDGVLLTYFGPVSASVDGLFIENSTFSRIANFSEKHRFQEWKNLKVVSSTYNQLFSFNCGAKYNTISDVVLDGNSVEYFGTGYNTDFAFLCSSGSALTSFGPATQNVIENVIRTPPGGLSSSFLTDYQRAPLVMFVVDDADAPSVEEYDGMIGNVFRGFRTTSGTIPEGPFTITSATAANPVVITTSTAHGFSNGDRVYIRNTEMEEINGEFFSVAGVTSTTFQLSGEDGTSRTPGTTGFAYVDAVPSCLFGVFDDGETSGSHSDEGESAVFARNYFSGNAVDGYGSDVFCIAGADARSFAQIESATGTTPSWGDPQGCGNMEGGDVVSYTECQ